MGAEAGKWAGNVPGRRGLLPIILCFTIYEKINNPCSLGGADIRLRLAGRVPIRVYLMSRSSLVLPLGKIVGSLLTFPFHFGGGGHSPG